MVELRVELLHAEPGARVVRVTAWRGELPLGSSLGEAASAELAEDQALARLLARLGPLAAAPTPALHQATAVGHSGRGVELPGSAGSGGGSGPAGVACRPAGAKRRRVFDAADAGIANPAPLERAPTASARAGSAGAGPAPTQEPEVAVAADSAVAAPASAAAPAAAAAATASTPDPLALPGPEAASGPPPDVAPPAGGAMAPGHPSAPADRADASLAPSAAGAIGSAAAAAAAPEAAPEAVALEPPPDPDDWSQELAGLELQLRRLGWGRDQEAVFLERAFGHPSRSRLTSYADLLAYLRALEGLAAGADPASAAVPLRRRDLLRLGDELLVSLGWSAARGRHFLEERLGQSSRQRLSDTELLRFNMLLEEELIQLDPAAPPAAALPGAALPAGAATAPG